MSVIGNALKAAQRERQRRDKGGDRPPPLLVPLRSKAQSSEFSLKRSLVLGLGGAAVFAVAVVGLKVVRGDSRAVAPFPAPIILGEGLAAGTARPALDSASPPSVGPASAKSSPPRVTSPAPVITPSSARSVASAPPVAAPQRQTAAASRQGASPSSASSTAAASDSGAAPARQPGGLRIAVEPGRENAARLFAAAVAAHRAGDLTYARAAYERVLVMAPADVDALNNMGVLLSAQREFVRAEQLLRRAASLAPRNAGVFNNLGTLFRERGQSSDAIAAYQHALAIDPQHQSARVSLAQQYLAIGSLPKARELLEEVVAANPAVPEAQYALGQVLELQGDRAGALRAYAAFVRVAPARFAAHIESVRRRMDELNARAP